jgi:hypothetical protein
MKQRVVRPGQFLQMTDGTQYVAHKSGAFIRTNKDHRPKKERTRARRAARKAR